MPSSPSVRFDLGASMLALVLAATSVPALAQTDPLTEAPGAARPAVEAPAGPAAEAQGAAEERATVNPTANEIIRSLAPFADGNPNAPRRYRDVDTDGGRARVDYGRAIDLTVFFAYDSATLTPEARIQLEPLGRALQSERLARHRFLLAGHTDAAGDRRYNQRLSFRRALEVKAYLVEAYGIRPGRLQVVGWGFSRLKSPEAPLSRVNRRVEVALIAPARGSRADEPSAGWEQAAFGPGCGFEEIRDPRLRKPLDLDDFAAAPAAVCAAALDMDDLTTYAPRR
ncbi:OmpA family protein [Methylopila musalis]|uniref:OmpA family protein n=1 Tax=Methylopila musalis TaxID=1134781 RepID=A0ABW3ZAN1_9HYPH